MRPALWLAALLAVYSGGVSAREFDISGYQEKNGAITSHYKGDIIDPYFATKALLLADDGGLDIRQSSLSWIRWAMHAQRGDGLFNRYRRDKNSNNWIVSYVADADDAILALWIDLLYRMSPNSGVPVAWQESLNLAENRLDQLYDKEQGVYHISTALPVGLLMDNSEIHFSLQRIARECKRLGLSSKARTYQQKAASLRAGIRNTFKREQGDYAITTQARTLDDFYPDRVAQIFPLMYGVENQSEAQDSYRTWLASHGKEWINQRTKDYPWGVVASLALGKVGDADSAACWKSLAEPMRHSGYWTVLEDAALQYINYRLELQKYDKTPCVGGNLI